MRRDFPLARSWVRAPIPALLGDPGGPYTRPGLFFTFLIPVSAR